MEKPNEIIQNTLPELRRGVITLAVLKFLPEEQYGYSLQKLLSDQGLEVEQGTLYPLLRRLETQGLLVSDWRIEDAARPRRYYKTSPQGVEALALLTEEWQNLVEKIAAILES